MGMSIFGGGWAYKPFSKFQFLSGAPFTNAAIGVYGSWTQMTSGGVPTLSIEARWMTITFNGNSAAPADYAYQFAIGPAGSQRLFPAPADPSAIDYFYVYFPVGGVLPGGDVLSYSFPITMPLNQSIWVRSYCGAVAGVQSSVVFLNLFG